MSRSDIPVSCFDSLNTIPWQLLVATSLHKENTEQNAFANTHGHDPKNTRSLTRAAEWALGGINRRNKRLNRLG